MENTTNVIMQRMFSSLETNYRTAISENEEVYTIYGNSNDDMCRQKEYDINSNVICGYGTPMY